MSLLNRFALAGALFCSTPFWPTSLSYAQTAVSPLPTTPLPLPPSRVLGPSGLRREAGRWLFNDSIFVTTGDDFAAPNSPVFVPNLRRDKKNKLPRFMPTATRGPLNWATILLPPLRDMSAPGFDFVGLQTRLTAQMATAKAQAQVFVGWSLPIGDIGTSTPLSKTASPLVIKRLRPLLDAIAPDSALILDVNGADAPLAVSDLDNTAPFCDAVVLHLDVKRDDALWPLKMARRLAEEQPTFDLPIFVAPAGTSPVSEGRIAEFFMGGATGFIVAPQFPIPTWENVVRRDKGFFTGAVTLEDAAVLPTMNPQTLQVVADLRAARRIPLIGRLPSTNKGGESLFVVLDNSTSLDTLAGVEWAASNGATIYMEGLPDLNNAALISKLNQMLSVAITTLPAPKPEMLSLTDPWIFGTARGQELPVTQRVQWTVKTTLADQTRDKRGQVSKAPYAAARLTSDENGLLSAPVGRGRILWLAHPPQLTEANAPARRAYISAIAGLLQASLVSWTWPSVEAQIQNANRVRVALRASPKGTPILALWNDAPTPATIALSARGDAPLALDLNTERELPATVSGYSSNLSVTIPAQGWTWLTFGTTRKELDKER